ncbi:mitochondrial carrier protein, amino-acid transporter arg-13 [Pseudohyphozyma bogoriensis]|nr:mitochondrial carrier protein, amino-acid transporter arg-13 [Pseudohyphozyma bogoriensis]
MDAELQHLEPAGAKSPIKDILYGSAAGIVSKLFEHPLDLVKVRLQSQPLDQPLKFNGPVDCMIQTFKGEGLKGLWRGVSMPIGGAMAENATLFVVYNQTQALLRRLDPPASPSSPTPISHLAFAAAFAGTCTSFVLTPVELVKCKMQVQNIVNSPSPSSSSTPSTSATPKAGPVAITRQIIARDGIKGLWLGQTGTVIRETGGSAAWFTTFELLSAWFVARRQQRGETSKSGGPVTKGDLSALELMASGAAAGVAYNCVLFPADCIKSTIQTEDELRGLTGGVGERRTFMQVGRDIYRARGIRGLYSGCGLTALRAAPSSALIFYIYSRLESIFG